MNRRLVLFVVAFLVAITGTGAVFVYVSQADSRAVAGQQLVRVLVANKHVTAGAVAGSLLTKNQVTVRSLPRSSVPADALQDLAGHDKEVTVVDLYPGDFLLAGKLAPHAAPNSGALTIPTGKMAVSVSLEDPRGVAGFVVPGSEVAVFDTFNVAPGGATEPSGDRLTDGYLKNRATRLLLGRVTVLAVGPDVTEGKSSSSDKSKKDAAGNQATAVALTLAVSQPDAEKLIHAAETGSLWFGLLSDSSKTAPSGGVDNHHLFTEDLR
jgi:pilus assembly protein CpaB